MTTTPEQAASVGGEIAISRSEDVFARPPISVLGTRGGVSDLPFQWVVINPSVRVGIESVVDAGTTAWPVWGYSIYGGIYPTAQCPPVTYRTSAFFGGGSNAICRTASLGTREGHLALSRWAPYVARRLLEMSDRTPVPGIKYPTRSVLERAWYLASAFFPESTPTPSVVPSHDGNVTFVWHKQNWDVEIDVDPRTVAVWARNRTTGETWQGEQNDVRARFSGLLRELSTD